MDTLQEQLSKLRLINNSPLSSGTRTISPSPSSSSASVATTTNRNQKGLATTGNIPCLLENEVSSKKVGPAVPPKPNKKINFQLPEVPQSMVVKQTCEPLYSKRLQSDSVKRMQLIKNKRPPVVDAAAAATLDSSTTSGPPLLQRKQPSYPIYTNNKVTLDNPAILDQQLEALEHHKKQLQKKGLLQNNNKIVPKLSSASFSVDGSSGEYMYSDIKAKAASRNHANVYSNMMNHQQQEPSAAVQKFPASTGRTFIYSNINYENDVDDLPPPPPPPPLEIETVLSLTADHLDFNNECNVNDEDDILPPPSPVSSSYSELRRATDIYPKLPSKIQAGTNSIMHNPGGQQQPRKTYMNMAYRNEQPYSSYESPSSQGSSAYESIYEPINPRPPSSHLSSRSNYLSCPSYVNSPHVSEVEAVETGQPNTSSLSIDAHLDGMDVVSGHSQKEAEVEALTDLLVHSMDPLNDVDSFGICVACNERVIGENSGCTAMDQVYHIDCFTCSQCQINLQGKPFYALDGKPYCEADYLNTLEKCSVCMKPILERILRATGKPYHPQCFTCVVCGNSLDGIPFTVDATNQNYCIADFHKKFAPRCCVCKLPIMPERGQEETVRVVALDRSFHFECYKCEDCGLLLSSEAEGRGCYPLDDHVLCKSCNAKRVQMLTNRMTTDL